MIQVNQRQYRSPTVPVVAICLDGCDPTYLDAAASLMPHLQRMIRQGVEGRVKTVIPSFTNPNNVAIVTGVPPAINGIPGNYYYDAETNNEVLMNDPKYLRAPTILAGFSNTDRRVAAVTTKDKLRLFLAKGWRGINFSVERAHETTLDEQGIVDVLEQIGRDNPGIYDPEASVFCLEAGAYLLEHDNIDVLFLSTTDYVQHKYVPGSLEANRFYARLDEFLGRLDATGAIVGITGDHGMNDKMREDGTPKVEYLESILTQASTPARVILPITDPYVVHHGALGSFATVYVDSDRMDRATNELRRVDGVEQVLTRREASQVYDLPSDRIGDLVVLANSDTVLGRTPDWHDLTVLDTGLRSHGGLHEGEVPLIVNRPLKNAYADRLGFGTARNFDLFDFLCNGVLG